MKMELIVSSETSAIRTQTPENYPKRNKLHLEHDESLKTRISVYRSPGTFHSVYFFADTIYSEFIRYIILQFL